MPKPDHVVMAALEWERRATYRYVNAYIRPAMRKLGVPFSYASRKKYATCEFLGGADGQTVLLPVHTDQSGEHSKLPEFCSNEWKQRVVMRWANEQIGWKERGVDCWIGISRDERHRRRAPQRLWFAPSYPLLDVAPMGVAGCLAAAARLGWPEPPRSRCYHCPNQSDAEWAELTPAEFELACKRDEWIRETDPNAYLHRAMIPLRTVTLRPEESSMFGGGCQAGTCF